MKHGRIKSRLFSCLLLGATITTVGCASKSEDRSEISGKNRVVAGNPNLLQTIGDSSNQFKIYGQEAFHQQVLSGKAKLVTATQGLRFLDRLASGRQMTGSVTKTERDVPTPDTSANSLLFGFPIKMLQKPMVFGSVVTKVSDKQNEDLGNLKMADLPPFQVRPVVSKTSAGEYFVSLLNCGADCSANTEEQQSVINIPVVGVNSEEGLAILNLASLGEELDLTVIRQGDPALATFKSKASQTVLFDYSEGTLVFDVEAHLVNKKATTETAETVITNRWYLKPETTFNPSFVSRKATPGVGFFMTERSDEPFIQRWDLDRMGTNEGVKYYIKNVPAEFQAAFAGAIDEWNEKLLPVLGKKILSYEFIPEGDPRNELLVAGDIRYNVVEWDLVNKASYGGLGPSIANQYTGELFHSNILIQGPTIIQLYTKWFKTQEEVRRLREEGREADADALLLQSHRGIQTHLDHLSSRSFKMSLGENLEMQIRSKQPSLQDPIMARDDFDEIPAGYTYSTYMNGYLHDMFAHEVGHTIGLRHNFFGSKGALPGEPVVGGVSRSIMEYLGRKFRHLDHIGEYDVMAIAYGYTGALPAHTNWFCTDEDAASLRDKTKSAECSSEDATSDPFGYFQTRLTRAVDLVVGKGHTSAPDWTLDDVAQPLQSALKGLGTYAVSAETTASTWTNFFNQENRPSSPAEVKPYVLQQLKTVLCDSSLNTEVSSKDSEEAVKKAQSNLDALRNKAVLVLKGVFSAADLACSSGT